MWTKQEKKKLHALSRGQPGRSLLARRRRLLARRTAKGKDSSKERSEEGKTHHQDLAGMSMRGETESPPSGLCVLEEGQTRIEQQIRNHKESVASTTRTEEQHMQNREEFIDSTPSDDDRNIHPGAVRIGGSSSSEDGSNDDMPTAQVDVLYSAEVLENPVATPIQKGWKLKVCLFLALCVVVIVITTTIVITNPGSGNNESSPSNSPFIVPTEVPLMPTVAPTWPSRCFETTEELKSAVGIYLDNPSPNSSLAQEYGYPIGSWCVSPIQDFSNVFSSSENPSVVTFNEPLGDWDTSRAQNMNSMFSGAIAFNQDLSNWDVSGVTQMAFMFSDVANVLNISNWDVSQVTDMHFMFATSQNFNSDIRSWDVSSVRVFSFMFNGAHAFNQDLSSWDLSSATTVASMFASAWDFNQNLCSWGAVLGGTNVTVDEMFTTTACSSEAEPDLLGDPAGPFCAEC